MPVLARAGNNVIFDHIIETPVWLADLVEFMRYDLRVDATRAAPDNASAVIEAWARRAPPTAMDKLAASKLATS